MAGLEFIGVRKTYPNGFRAIHGVDTSVADGAFIVIVGPSGCGKSTLLRMVAGLETVTEGEIRIGGRPVNALEPADRNIAMVFQNYALYPHMSVFDNMAYGLRNRRTPKDEIERRVADASRILQLDGMLDRRPSQLSGGQRQRVAMGRAIVREPEVFLFDEPLSNLDAKLRVQMRLGDQAAATRPGDHQPLRDHDQVEAMTLADRLIVMNAGVAEQIGSPLDVYAEPATVFVAGFIGSPAMNFLAGDAPPRTGRGVVLDGSAQALPFPLPSSAPRGKVTVGIRPEHLEPVSRDAATLELAVDLVEALGADSLVHGQLAGDGQGACRDGSGSTAPLRVAAGEDASAGAGAGARPFLRCRERPPPCLRATGSVRRLARAVTLITVLGGFGSMTAQAIEVQGHRGARGLLPREHHSRLRARHRARRRRPGARPRPDPGRGPRRASRPGAQSRSHPGRRPARGFRGRDRLSGRWIRRSCPNSTSAGPLRTAGPRSSFRSRRLATERASRPCRRYWRWGDDPGPAQSASTWRPS